VTSYARRIRHRVQRGRATYARVSESVSYRWHPAMATSRLSAVRWRGKRKASPVGGPQWHPKWCGCTPQQRWSA
jgi:hypothetical protein